MASVPTENGTSVPSHHPLLVHVKSMASQEEEMYPQFPLNKPLPKPPVPQLKSTLDKYLLCIKPIVSEEQYKESEAIVKEFGRPGGLGETLQEKLLQFAETTNNWIYDFWMDDMYLNIRLPLPVNSNPGMVFPRQQFEDESEQLRFAARFISVILDYKDVIDTRSLPVDRARHREKGQPLCMEQYYRLFTSYRAPGRSKDVQMTGLPASNHCIVACQDKFFKLNVVVNRQRLSSDLIYAQLKRIVKMAEESDRQCQVGILTAANRDHWAAARESLLNDPQNEANFREIEECMFIVCLDRAMPISFNHQRSVDETNLHMRDDVSLALQTLHGHGAKHNAANRWFDKTMQFIVGKDGACGLCYEHSPSEGIAVVQLIEQLLQFMDDARRKKLQRLQSLCDLPAPVLLKWNVPDDVNYSIQSAGAALDSLIANTDLYALRFMDYGKKFPKSQNMSPDAYIQLALQLAYYTVHGRLVSTYESASIRRFRLGRVDNIRACTLEALEWCRAMVGEVKATMEEKLRLLRKAMKRQTEILVQTILGHGIDNHLLGLREIAAKLELPKPDIFQDPSYTMSNHFSLSTSQVPTNIDSFMCYGPVVPDGYGACYNPLEDYMIIVISSFKSCDQTGSDHFAYTLENCLRKMKEVIISAPAKSSDAAPGEFKDKMSSKQNAADLNQNSHS